MLRGVHVGGCWIEEPSRVKEEIKLFFKRRFEEVKWERDLGWMGSNSSLFIGQQLNDLSVARFEEDEVRAAMWDCSGA